MAMTKEQLLIHRYMCTGTPGKELWPGSRFQNGDVINISEKEWITKSWAIRMEVQIKDFPHLFRPMPWWEGRKPEDMPEWFKFSENYMNFKAGSVYETECWSDKLYACIQFRSEEGLCGVPFGKWVAPATEQEYLDYQKQKEEK